MPLIRDADAPAGRAPSSEAGPQARAAARASFWKRAVLGGAILAGLAVTIGFVVRIGLAAVAASLARLGLVGFAVFLGYTLAVFVLLGVSWFVIATDLKARTLPAFVFGRLAREAASDILPFSQLGGFLVGVRAALVLRAPFVPTVASAVVDLGTEMVGQLFFTATGFALLIAEPPRGFPARALDPLLALGLAACAITAVIFIASQRAGLGLLGRLSTRWPAAMRMQLDGVRDELRRMYRRPARPLLSVVLHFAAWIAATGGVWLVLRFMGSAIPMPAVIAMESLIYLIRSVAFFVPGALGVLEGGYVILGPMFGLRPEIALSLSLVKRGRDLALGAPFLLIWQAFEGRRLLAARGRRAGPDDDGPPQPTSSPTLAA